MRVLPPGITRLRGWQYEEDTRLYWNGRDSTCPSEGYNAEYLYYPTKSATRLSVIQLISSAIGTPMNILGPVPRSLSRRLVKTRVPAISEGVGGNSVANGLGKRLANAFTDTAVHRLHRHALLSLASDSFPIALFPSLLAQLVGCLSSPPDSPSPMNPPPPAPDLVKGRHLQLTFSPPLLFLLSSGRWTTNRVCRAGTLSGWFCGFVVSRSPFLFSSADRPVPRRHLKAARLRFRASRHHVRLSLLKFPLARSRSLGDRGHFSSRTTFRTH